MSTERPIEVVLVTGFLGTGKTSLIRAFLEGRDTSRVGVIVNEAGDTGFDGIVIAEGTGESSAVRMLGNGCLCCEAADDLAQSVRDLVARHVELTGAPSECIIVEASGLARPGKLLRQFHAITDIPLQVHVVSTVDATLAADPDRHGEIPVQWAAASSLVLTRRDLAGDDGQEAMTRAWAVNPLASFQSEGSAAERAAEAFAATGRANPLPQVEFAGEVSHGSIRAVTLWQSPGANWDDCTEWLDNLAGIGDERVLRVKGLVSPLSADRSWLVQAVGTTFAVPVPISREAGHVVVIGEDLTAEWFAAIEPAGTFTLPDTGAHSHEGHRHD
ncbi:MULTISPECIES: GTP-binding protein [unclassified Sphingobium]|uniref:GTP-binding protein n=1 Tax=unclassified Sphingobium TaxID=2611147 RepID=UPI000D16408D|nr:MULTISPECIES: GTP-binding protein [unclassified Sphingobium]PSO09702.1 hypothetical protein C7E20_20975 [Sphingobium sp. AEW4]TWD19023.1 G3E family GTPase [Sphingobium sp. AEW013]